MKSFNNFITERTKRDPNRPGGQTGSGRPSGAGRADAYADFQDPANTPRKGTGPAPRINPNPIPKVDPSKFSGAVDPDEVDVEKIFKRIQGTGAVGTASKAEIQAAIDAARGSDPHITKLASQILGGEKGETPEVVGKAALPFVVIVLTLSLLGVVYFVGKARREEVKKRIAEQSSLVSVLESGD